MAIALDIAMKHLRSLLLPILISMTMLCLSGSARQKINYRILTSKEYHSHLEDKDIISPKAFIPINFSLRENLKIFNSYREDKKAHEELLVIYTKLRWAWNNSTAKNWNHQDNIKILTSFIKKYPNTCYAVTAKLMLGEVVGTPFFTDYGGIYWALDLWGEIYEQFPDKWQGKVALFYIYEKIYYPSVSTKAEWAYQYIDDFENIAFELEELHFSKDLYTDYAEYEDLRRLPLRWDQVWMGYCDLSLYLESKNLRTPLLNDSRRIACHQLEVCTETNWCPLAKISIQTYLLNMSRDSDKAGLCAVPSGQSSAITFDWKTFCSKPFNPPPRQRLPW
jgi:hypothetical protein